MRKLATTIRLSDNFRQLDCPHCQKVNTIHKSTITGNEVGRQNFDHSTYITYNFKCPHCSGELQTGLEINKSDQIIN